MLLTVFNHDAGSGVLLIVLLLILLLFLFVFVLVLVLLLIFFMLCLLYFRDIDVNVKPLTCFTVCSGVARRADTPEIGFRQRTAVDVAWTRTAGTGILKSVEKTLNSQRNGEKKNGENDEKEGNRWNMTE